LTLLVKTQLKDYEPGEFSDVRQRTYPETSELIEKFPWSGERDHFAVGPTSPSITIEGQAGDYLKLALYYHEKFILYYLDLKNHLWVLPITTLSEAYPLIESFFDHRLDLASFKRQSTFSNNKAHFATKDFHYTMRGRYFIPAYGILSISCCTVYPIATILAGVRKTSLIPVPAFIILAALSLIFLITGIFIMALSINHYRESRNKILYLSRGNTKFFYGEINAPTAYDKKDILRLVQYGGTRGDDRLSRTEIIFKDGSSINISGLILSSDKVAAKFPHQAYGSSSFGFRMYFIPRAASAPS
jgi:hypothetical protein